MQTIKPANNQLFCKPTEKQTKTKSGLLIAENLAEKPQTAEIINIGDKVTQFHQKDTIVYKSYATSEIKLDGEEYFLISEEDVLGTLIDADKKA